MTAARRVSTIDYRRLEAHTGEVTSNPVYSGPLSTRAAARKQQAEKGILHVG